MTWGFVDDDSSKPNFLSKEVKGSTLGIDLEESKDPENKKVGIDTPGWVKHVTYRTSNGMSRFRNEVLIATKRIVDPENPYANPQPPNPNPPTPNPPLPPVPPPEPPVPPPEPPVPPPEPPVPPAPPVPEPEDNSVINIITDQIQRVNQMIQDFIANSAKMTAQAALTSFAAIGAAIVAVTELLQLFLV